MASFIREKRIFCGKRYQEIDVYPYASAQKKAAKGKRGKKLRESAPKQKDLNDKNARRYFTQVAALNFLGDPGALHISATYSEKYLPDSMEEAEKTVQKYLRRLAYARKKKGLPPLKYLLATACVSGKDGEPARIHHHIIVNGGLNRDQAEELWRQRRKKGQKQGEAIGYCNVDRLQGEEEGIGALCNYLIKQTGGKKRWSCSHNLDRPQSRTADDKFTRRQVEKWARLRPGKEFWERKYPGWTPVGEHGVEFAYNQATGWSLYLRLKRKEGTA